MNVAFFLKKIGACVFLSTVFFLSLLAGKSATVEQMLLTESIKKKNGAYVLRAPDFFWQEKLTRWKGLNKFDYNV